MNKNDKRNGTLPVLGVFLSITAADIRLVWVLIYSICSEHCRQTIQFFSSVLCKRLKLKRKLIIGLFLQYTMKKIHRKDLWILTERLSLLKCDISEFSNETSCFSLNQYSFLMKWIFYWIVWRCVWSTCIKRSQMLLRKGVKFDAKNVPPWRKIHIISNTSGKFH